MFASDVNLLSRADPQKKLEWWKIWTGKAEASCSDANQILGLTYAKFGYEPFFQETYM